MGVSYSTAKWLVSTVLRGNSCLSPRKPNSLRRWQAPASFLIDFAAQQYGMLSKPNMLDVHNQNLSFWSPQVLDSSSPTVPVHSV
jgi:hypothetical protein